MDAGLISNIIILITAIVGLITALVSINSSKKSEESGPVGALSTALTAIITSLPVFIIPLAIISLLFYVNSRLNNDEQFSIQKNLPDATKMYRLSQEIWDQSLRQNLLPLVIEKALTDENYEIVLRAAKDLNPTNQADPVLKKAIEQIAGTVKQRVP
jgi:hypothetical protein